MAEEKTEKPSPHKLLQAKKKGQVSKSQDFVSLVVIASFLLIFLFFFHGFSKLLDFSIHLWQNLKPEVNLLSEFKGAINLSLKILIPFLGLLFLAILLAHILQFGFIFSSHPIRFDLKRINPISGFINIFSKDRLLNLLKNFLKFMLIISSFYVVLKFSLKDIILLSNLDAYSSFLVLKGLSLNLVKILLIVFLLIATIDFFLQRYIFLKSLRMTKYEIKKEYKEQEGDPFLKSERKRRYEELLEEASVSLDNASVLIANPSHIAIALAYDHNKEEAPRVVAKAYGKDALKLKDLAKAQNIYVLRNMALAQDLSFVKINEEIPERLYQAVAEVLMFVYELNYKNEHHD